MVRVRIILLLFFAGATINGQDNYNAELIQAMHSISSIEIIKPEIMEDLDQLLFVAIVEMANSVASLK